VAVSVSVLDARITFSVNWSPGLSAASSATSWLDVGQLRQIQQIAPVETLQPQYSLIERAVERQTLPFAEREGIGVIVYSPMGSGMLSGVMTRTRIAGLAEDDWRKHDARFSEPQLSRNLGLVERLRSGARLKSTPGVSNHRRVAMRGTAGHVQLGRLSASSEQPDDACRCRREPRNRNSRGNVQRSGTPSRAVSLPAWMSLCQAG
jgi:hypothetical protein